MKTIKRLVSTLIISSLGATAASAGYIYMGPSLGLTTLTGPDSSYRVLSPKLSVGYANLNDNNLYLAGEAFVNLASISLTNNNNNGASLRTGQTFGISFIPGVNLNDTTLGYARVSAVTTEFNSPGKYSVGGQLGVGLETNVANHWDLRGEYIFTAYSHVTGIGSPKADTFMMGLMRKFD